jgi:hypothetical protein
MSLSIIYHLLVSVSDKCFIPKHTRQGNRCHLRGIVANLHLEGHPVFWGVTLALWVTMVCLG